MKIPLSTPPAPASTPDAAPARSPLAKMAGRVIAVFFTLGALLFLWYMFEDWRGGRVWSRYAESSLARGWRFDWEYFAPPPVPDEENFARTPCLAPLFEFDFGTQYWRDTNAALRTVGLDERIKELARSKGIAISRIQVPRFDAARRLDLSGIVVSSNHAGLPTNSAAFKGETAEKTRETAAKCLLDLVDACGKPIFDELRLASRKPKSRFDVKYRAVPLASVFMPHLPALQHLSVQLSWRAYANLELNNIHEAFEDALLIFYLSDTLRGEPMLLSHHTRLSCRAIAAQVIYAGMAKWSEAQLKMIQDGLVNDRFAADSFQCMLAERAYSLRMVDQVCTRDMSIELLSGGNKVKNMEFWLTVMPAGWYYFEAIHVGRSYDKMLAAMEEWLQGKRNIQSAIADTSAWPGEAGTPEAAKPFSLSQALWDHTVLLRLMGPGVNKSFLKSLQAQVRTEQVIEACALERYRLAKGEYPETDEMLVPAFLEKPLPDPFSNGPLKYRRETPASYILYSVGSNLADDGGKVEFDANGSVQSDKSDLVWILRGAR